MRRPKTFPLESVKMMSIFLSFASCPKYCPYISSSSLAFIKQFFIISTSSFDFYNKTMRWHLVVLFHFMDEEAETPRGNVPRWHGGPAGPTKAF